MSVLQECLPDTCGCLRLSQEPTFLFVKNENLPFGLSSSPLLLCYDDNYDQIQSVLSGKGKKLIIICMASSPEKFSK